MALPINLEDLLYAHAVEDNRREFKAAWNEAIRPAVLKTVCAFANDLLNLNGGYIILGIGQDAANRPVLPPRGLEDADPDFMQRQIRGDCKHCISPEYYPPMSVEQYQGRQLLVCGAPGATTHHIKPQYRRRRLIGSGKVLKPLKLKVTFSDSCSRRPLAFPLMTAGIRLRRLKPSHQLWCGGFLQMLEVNQAVPSTTAIWICTGR